MPTQHKSPASCVNRCRREAQSLFTSWPEAYPILNPTPAPVAETRRLGPHGVSRRQPLHRRTPVHSTLRRSTALPRARALTARQSAVVTHRINLRIIIPAEHRREILLCLHRLPGCYPSGAKNWRLLNLVGQYLRPNSRASWGVRHVRQRIKRSHRPKFILHLINDSCPVSDLLLPE